MTFWSGLADSISPCPLGLPNLSNWASTVPQILFILTTRHLSTFKGLVVIFYKKNDALTAADRNKIVLCTPKPAFYAQLFASLAMRVVKWTLKPPPKVLLSIYKRFSWFLPFHCTAQIRYFMTQNVRRAIGKKLKFQTADGKRSLRSAVDKD